MDTQRLQAARDLRDKRNEAIQECVDRLALPLMNVFECVPITEEGADLLDELAAYETLHKIVPPLESWRMARLTPN